MSPRLGQRARRASLCIAIGSVVPVTQPASQSGGIAERVTSISLEARADLDYELNAEIMLPLSVRRP